MEDIAEELLEKIQETFQEGYNKSSVISGLLQKIESGTATYREAEEFAVEAGEILSAALQKNLSGDVLPDGILYYNIAEKILNPTLSNNYDIISDAAVQVQQSLNEAAGIGIKAIRAELNEDKIEGLVNKVSGHLYDDIAWVLGYPIVNFSQSIVDDTVKANVDFQGGAGLMPKVIRTLHGKACAWCTSLAGTYSYPDVPKDVYRRHENCRCTVEYDPGSGKRQNVHTKQWTTPEERAKIEARKNLGRNPTISLSNDKYDMDDTKISQFLLKPGAKHASDFFGVGYSIEDGALLNTDIYAGFNEKKKVDSIFLADGAEKFSIFMNLGNGGKSKQFRTVWIKDTPTSKPRFITAHRED